MDDKKLKGTRRRARSRVTAENLDAWQQNNKTRSNAHTAAENNAAKT